MLTMWRIAGRVVALSLAIALGGCGSTPETCNTLGGTCAKGGSVKSCCTPDLVMCDVIASDGTDFPCDNGNQCSAAEMAASNWCQTH